MRSIIIASVALFMTSPLASGAEFGELAGTYTGKTPKGGDIVVVVPKSGNPTYRFRGAPVIVSNAKVFGKTISMNVGPNGMGRVILSSSGQGMSYKYTDNKGGTTASLTKR
jgi:hypothetical protein